jgi:GMP synthase (glutamine-hydrolysing)
MAQSTAILAPDVPPPGVEVVPILDFGSQYVQLIARRVREAGAYSASSSPPDIPIEQLAALRPEGDHPLRRAVVGAYEEGAPTLR